MIKPKLGWFLAFTAFFAVLAGFVFWGTWSLDMVPVMPDCPTQFSGAPLQDWIVDWRMKGRFVPGDLLPLNLAAIGLPQLGVELQYVLALYAAALGMAYFLRGWGCSRLSSYGAGIFLAFSGYWATLFSAGHLGWFQWMTYGPFAFGLIDRALEKGRLRHWFLLGACLAWSSFYQPDLWFLFTLFTVAYFLFRWISRGLSPEGRAAGGLRAAFFPRRLLLGAAASLGVFLLVGLPSFHHAIYVDLTTRNQQISEGQTTTSSGDEAEQRWEFVTNWSMPPEDTLEFFQPRIHGDTSCPMTVAIKTANGDDIRPYTGRLGRKTGSYRQHSLYVGRVTCLLVLLSLVGLFAPSRHRAKIIFFLVSALVFWTFSLGRFCEPVYRCVYAFPMLNSMRDPVKWHHLTEFSLVVLAGVGLEVLRERLARTRLSVRAATGIVLVPVLIGGLDLASQAHRFCAPHHADTELFSVVEHPVPTTDTVLQQRLASAIERRGCKAIGYVPVSMLTSDPRGKGLSLLWCERPQKALPRSLEQPLSPVATLMAVSSALATLALIVYLIVCQFYRRLDRLEMK